MPRERQSKKPIPITDQSPDNVHIDRRSGGVYVQDGKLYVRGNLIGRDYIVINLPPINWYTLSIGLGVPALLVTFLVGRILIWSSQDSYASNNPRIARQGWINLAVASFGEITDGQGRVVDSKAGYKLATIFFRSLDSYILNLQSEIFDDSQYGIGLLGPDEINVIVGDKEERQKNASLLAEKKEVDIILSGYVKTKDGVTIFTPELFISPAKLAQAEELTGMYSLGETIKMYAPIDKNSVIGDDIVKRIMGGPGAFTYFLYGLGRYQNYEFDEAKSKFELALRKALAAEESLKDQDSNTINLLSVSKAKVTALDMYKIYYLFMAKSYYEAAITSNDRDIKIENWELARQYYTKALEFDPDYARAQLGIADTTFQMSKDGCQKGDEDLDEAGLKDAVRQYEQLVEKSSDQSELVDFPTKLAFYLGRAYYCQSRAQVDDHWVNAKDNMCRVVNEYETGKNSRIQLLASEAHGMQGLIYWDWPVTNEQQKLNNLQIAADQYRQAIRLAMQRDRQCFLYDQLTQISEFINDTKPGEQEWAEKNCSDIEGTAPKDNFPREFPYEIPPDQEVNPICAP